MNFALFLLGYLAIGIVTAGVFHWAFEGKDFVAGSYFGWHGGNTFVCVALWWLMIPIVSFVAILYGCMSILPSPVQMISSALSWLEKRGRGKTGKNKRGE